MPIISGGGPGQREFVVRGERTDPIAIIEQAVGGALACDGCFLVAFLILVVITWPTLRLGQPIVWKSLLVCLLLPWILYFGFAAHQLYIEIYDPNHPAPRAPIATKEPILPGTKDPPPPEKAPMPKPKYLIFGGD